MMTEKKERFCREYIIDLNGFQAMLRAGYSKTTAAKQLARLLSEPEVTARIAELKQESTQRLEITADRVLQEIARIAFLDPARVFDEDGTIKPITEMDEDTRRAIGSLEVTQFGQDGIGILSKVKLIDKKGGLEMLAKHLKLLTQVHEHTGKDGGPISFAGWSDKQIEEYIARDGSSKE